MRRAIAVAVLLGLWLSLPAVGQIKYTAPATNNTLGAATAKNMTVAGIADPAAPTVTPQGTTGATTYGYKVAAVLSDGTTTTAASAEGTTATGNATLDGTNFNRVTWSAVTGATSYSVYRSAGGATQGKIATTLSALTFDDTGIAASGAAPTTNSTGQVLVQLGTGTGRGRLGGVLCKAAPAATTAGTVEAVLATCTVPANTLDVGGSRIIVYLSATTAANGNNKQLRVRLGGLAGVLLYDSAAAASNNQSWTSDESPVTLTRLSATTVSGYGLMRRANLGGTATTTAMVWMEDSEVTDWTAAQDLVITGTTPTAAGDITLREYLILVLQ